MQELLEIHFDRLESLLRHDSSCLPPQLSCKESLRQLPTASEASTSQPNVADAVILQQASAEETADLTQNSIAAPFKHLQVEIFRSTVTGHDVTASPCLEEPGPESILGSQFDRRVETSSRSPCGFNVPVESSTSQEQVLTRSCDCFKTPQLSVEGGETTMDSEAGKSGSSGTRATTHPTGISICSSQPEAGAAFAGWMGEHEFCLTGGHGGTAVSQLKPVPCTEPDCPIQIQQIPAWKLLKLGPEGGRVVGGPTGVSDPACQDAPLNTTVIAPRTGGSVAAPIEPPWLNSVAEVDITVPGCLATDAIQDAVPIPCSGVQDQGPCSSSEREGSKESIVILAKDEIACSNSGTRAGRSMSCPPRSLREGSGLHSGIGKSLPSPRYALAGSSSRGSPLADSAIIAGALGGRGPLVADLVWYLPEASEQLEVEQADAEPLRTND